MEAHFAEPLTLDDLTAIAHCSRSYLIRVFTQQVGVSPYRYLQTIRLNQAKKWLEQGLAPSDAANQAGFSDQSHFTHFFKDFIGLTPKQYQRIYTSANSTTVSYTHLDVYKRQVIIALAPTILSIAAPLGVNVGLLAAAICIVGQTAFLTPGASSPAAAVHGNTAWVDVKQAYILGIVAIVLSSLCVLALYPLGLLLF